MAAFKDCFEGAVPAREHGDEGVDVLVRCWTEQREALLRFCRRSLGRVDAEDALSRATVSMLRAATSTGGIRWPAAWFQEIVHHACVDVHRERARRERYLLAHADEELVEPAPTAHDPERSLLERETLARVESAIRVLHPSLRTALLLRVEDDLPYAEMAALLLDSEDNLRKRVQLARREVRRAVLSDDEA